MLLISGWVVLRPTRAEQAHQQRFHATGTRSPLKTGRIVTMRVAAHGCSGNTMQADRGLHPAETAERHTAGRLRERHRSAGTDRHAGSGEVSVRCCQRASDVGRPLASGVLLAVVSGEAGRTWPSRLPATRPHVRTGQNRRRSPTAPASTMCPHEAVATDRYPDGRSLVLAGQTSTVGRSVRRHHVGLVHQP